MTVSKSQGELHAHRTEALRGIEPPTLDERSKCPKPPHEKRQTVGGTKVLV